MFTEVKLKDYVLNSNIFSFFFCFAAFEINKTSFTKILARKEDVFEKDRPRNDKNEKVKHEIKIL